MNFFCKKYVQQNERQLNAAKIQKYRQFFEKFYPKSSEKFAFSKKRLNSAFLL